MGTYGEIILTVESFRNYGCSNNNLFYGFCLIRIEYLIFFFFLYYYTTMLSRVVVFLTAHNAILHIDILFQISFYLNICISKSDILIIPTRTVKF